MELGAGDTVAWMGEMPPDGDCPVMVCKIWPIATGCRAGGEAGAGPQVEEKWKFSGVPPQMSDPVCKNLRMNVAFDPSHATADAFRGKSSENSLGNRFSSSSSRKTARSLYRSTQIETDTMKNHTAPSTIATVFPAGFESETRQGDTCISGVYSSGEEFDSMRAETEAFWGEVPAESAEAGEEEEDHSSEKTIPHSALQAICRSLGRYPVMDRNEELECAKAMHEHRRNLIGELGRSALGVDALLKVLCENGERAGGGWCDDFVKLNDAFEHAQGATGPDKRERARRRWESLRSALVQEIQDKKIPAHLLEGAVETVQGAVGDIQKALREIQSHGADEGAVREFYRETARAIWMPEDELSSHVRALHRELAGMKKEREKLLCSNQRFVISCVKKFNRGRIPLEDLIQVGNALCLSAIDKFDPAKGNRFCTYLGVVLDMGIRREIDNLSRTVSLPVRVCEKLRKLSAIKKQLTHDGVLEPSVELLARRMGIPEKEVRDLEHIDRDTVSIDQPAVPDSKRTHADRLEAAGCWWESFHGEENRAWEFVKPCLKLMNCSQRRVISAFFEDESVAGKSEDQVADALGLSLSQVRAFLRGALAVVEGFYRARRQAVA